MMKSKYDMWEYSDLFGSNKHKKRNTNKDKRKTKRKITKMSRKRNRK
jgi:hypothetical protein